MEIGLNLGTVLQAGIVIGLGAAYKSWTSMRKELHQLHRDLGIWQSKIDTVLFGPTGSNGLSGTLKQHEARLHDLERQAHAP